MEHAAAHNQVTISDLLENLPSILDSLDARIRAAEERAETERAMVQLRERREKAASLGLQDVVSEIDALLARLEEPADDVRVAEETAEAEPENRETEAEDAPLRAQELEATSRAAVTIAPAGPSADELAELGRAITELNTAVNAAIERDYPDKEHRMAVLKAIVCRYRALDEKAANLRVSEHSLDAMRERLSDEIGGSFWCLNRRTRLSEETWQRLAEAYEALPLALECATWLEAHAADLEPDQAKALLPAAAAVEARVWRLAQDNAGKFDEQQVKLHKRLESLGQSLQVYVPHWEPDARLSAIHQATLELPRQFSYHRPRIEKRATVSHAMGRLRALTEDPAAGDDFDKAVIEAAAKCLDGGMQPSNKELRDLLAPFAALFEDVEDKKLVKLHEYLLKDAAEAPADEELQAEPADSTDPDFETKLAAVLPHTRGKRMMFLGGKTQEERRKQIEQALELDELAWPDCEPDTKIETLRPAAMRADIICYVIRWARQAGRDLMNDCKREGKTVVRLPAGLGLHQVVHQLHSQTVRP